ncbi:MAG: hypothetical protein KC609_08315 [Myxococcales bacterium]|nr:hypothetical protein [Myxococcales bacterium]
MKEVILALRRLQEIDDQVRSFEEEYQEILERLERYRTVRDRMGDDLEAKKQDLSEAERLIRDQEEELKVAKERESKAKSKLSTAMKTKQYIAAQRELEQIKRVNTTREEELIQLLEQIEINKKTIKELDEKFQTLKEEIGREEESYTQRLGELKEKIGSVEHDRQDCTKRLPREIVGRYNRIKRARAGVAMVPVRNERCTGCNMMIQPQLYNHIMRMETLESCPQCSRFLFTPEELIITGEVAEAS